MFETSKREAFSEAWKALRSLSAVVLPRTLLAELRTLPHRPPCRLGRGNSLLLPEVSPLPGHLPLVAKVDSRPHPEMKP